MTDSPKLTARQHQILQLVQHAIARTGAPPTRAEIAAERLEFMVIGSAKALDKACEQVGLARNTLPLSMNPKDTPEVKNQNPLTSGDFTEAGEPFGLPGVRRYKSPSNSSAK